MPSNECTTTLMELGFAVGNMVGAEECQVEDWNQIIAILDRGWECSIRGDIGDAKTILKKTAEEAKRACAGGACPPAYCVDLFTSYWDLAQEMGVYKPELVGRAKRSAIPRLVKGPEGVQKSQTGDQQHTAEMDRVDKRRKAKEDLTKAQKAARALEASQERQRVKDEADRIVKEGAERARLAALNEPEPVGTGARYANEGRRRWYPEN